MMEDDTIEEGLYLEEIQRLITPTNKNNFDEYFSKVIPKAQLKEFGRKDYNYAYVSMFPLETKEKTIPEVKNTVKKRKKIPQKLHDKMTAEVIIAPSIKNFTLEVLEREFMKIISLGEKFVRPKEKKLVKVKSSEEKLNQLNQSMNKNYENFSKIIDNATQFQYFTEKDSKKKISTQPISKERPSEKVATKTARKSCQQIHERDSLEIFGHPKKELVQTSISPLTSSINLSKNSEKEKNERKVEEKKVTTSHFLVKKSVDEKKTSFDEKKKSPELNPLLDNSFLTEKINKKPVYVPIQSQAPKPEILSGRKMEVYDDVNYGPTNLNSSANISRNTKNYSIVQVHEESDGDDDCSLINKRQSNNTRKFQNDQFYEQRNNFQQNNNNKFNFVQNQTHNIPNFINSHSITNNNNAYTKPPNFNQNTNNPNIINFNRNPQYMNNNNNLRNNIQNNAKYQIKSNSKPFYEKSIDKQEFYRKKYGINGPAGNGIINNNPKFARDTESESPQNFAESNGLFESFENFSKDNNNLNQVCPSNKEKIFKEEQDQAQPLNNIEAEFNLDSFLDNFSKKPKTNEKSPTYTVANQDKVSSINDIESFIKNNFKQANIVKPSDKSFEINDFLNNISKNNTPHLSSRIDKSPIHERLPFEINNNLNQNSLKNSSNCVQNPSTTYSNDPGFNVINNNFNLTKIEIINHDNNILKDEVSQCLSCQWRFPLNFTLNEKNAHIDRCFEGYGQQDKENYLSSLTEANKLENKPKDEQSAATDNFLCIVCKKYRNTNMNILEKHINDCLEEEAEKEKYTGKKRKNCKNEKFDPEDYDNSRVFFKKKFN